jgi:tRNA(Ser,Leu) C12 N-acetylase TAN1
MGLLFVTVASGFERDAISELLRALGGDGAWCRTAFKGVVLVTTSLDGREAAKALGDRDTRLIARVTPIDRVVRAELQGIVAAVLSIGGIGAEDAFAVRCRRRGSHGFSSRDVERSVGSAIDQGHVDLECPEKVVSVEILFNRAYVSVLRADEIVEKKILVERKWERGKRPLNRSELKMLEILQRYPDMAPSGIALDLGAAPGGWSKVLSRYVELVYAVDPAPLDAEVAALGNVTHLPKKLEELNEDDIPRRAGLIACDANISARELAPLMGPVVRRFLAADGFLALTLKAVTGQPRRELEVAAEVMAKEMEGLGVEVLAVTKLPHNTRSEMTFIGRRHQQ